MHFRYLTCDFRRAYFELRRRARQSLKGMDTHFPDYMKDLSVNIEQLCQAICLNQRAEQCLELSPAHTHARTRSLKLIFTHLCAHENSLMVLKCSGCV